MGWWGGKALVTWGWWALTRGICFAESLVSGSAGDRSLKDGFLFVEMDSNEDL